MSSYAENIIKLRSRIQDAVKKGLVETTGKDFYEATLIQIMNDAERNRQNCLTQAENLRRQASVFDGQAAAFGSITSIVFNVINGYVSVAEKDEAERLATETEPKTEVLDPVVTDLAAAPKKRQKKKS